MRGLLIAILVCAAAVSAQAPRARSRVDVVVSDAAGKPVTNLGKDAFTLLEDSAPREIQTFSPTDTPWNFVLLFDHSLPWVEAGDATLWRTMGQSVDRFLAQMNPQDRVTMATFENKVQMLMDWRNAKTGREQTITFNPIVRGTDGTKDLHGAIAWAAEKLRGAKGRSAVIVFTDGRDGRLAPQWLVNDARQEVFDPLFGMIDTAEAEEFSKTLELIQKCDARFYFVAVNTTQPPSFRGRPISGLYPGAKDAVANYLSRIRLRLEKMAEVSDGAVLYGKAPEDAIIGYRTLYRDLALGVRYTLEFATVPNTDTLPARLAVRLRDPNLKVELSKAAR
jgi:VWFA-related protein